MSDPIIGRQLGDYVVQELLGRGGMARVYRGYDARLMRYAAVKVISSDLSTADQAEYTERFRKEARSIARLNHPNVVGVYQFGEQNDLYYMAMVFVEGKDLRQIIRDVTSRGETVPIGQALAIVKGISAALDYAHTRGVIHRDVKPSNIMLDIDGHPVLTDFGLALNTQDGTLGDTFGSAHYIAPEQAISSARAVPQSDLYSLGICIYEMLTGYVPFDDPSAMTVAMKHLNEVPPSPRQYNPGISPAVERIILKVLEKDPKRRPETGAELTQALESALSGGDDDLQKLLNATNDQKSDPHRSSLKLMRTSTKADLQPVKTPTDPPTLPLTGPGSGNARPDSKQLPTGSTVIGTLPPVKPPAARRSTQTAASVSRLGGDNVALNVSKTGLRTPEERLSSLLDAPAGQSRRIWVILGMGLLVIAAMVGILSALTGSSPAATPTAGTEANTSVAVLSGSETATAEATPSTPTLTTPTPTTPEAVSRTPSRTPRPPTSTRTPRPTNTPVPPTATPTRSGVVAPNGQTPVSGGQLSVVYNKDQLNLINTSGTLLNINPLTFVQRGSSERRFSTLDWNSEFAAYPTTAWPNGRCYQLTRIGLGVLQPLPSCLRIAAFRAVRPDVQFWVAQADSVTTFEVLWNDSRIATCEIAAGRCSVMLPKE
jgi:serine/threonine protein kinase